jgi:amino acid adenylation domain-containing protein
MENLELVSAVPLSDAKRLLLDKLLRGAASIQSWEQPLVPHAPGERIPLAPSQQQVWLHSQMAPDAPLYNEPMTLHYRGELNRQALERSFHEILRRHEIWRSSFAFVDGQVVQAVHEDLTVSMPLSDLSILPEDQRDAEAVRLATADAKRVFDVGAGPLLRMRLCRFTADYHRLYITLHHLLFDGVSIFGVLLPELYAIYEAFSNGRPSPLPEPQFQYADYAIWQRRMLDNDVAARQIDYWRDRLSGELPTLQLPTDRQRPAVPSFRGGMEKFSVSSEITEAVKEISRAEGVTPYMLLLASFKALLHRYSGQEDVLIGGVMDNRCRQEFTGLMGYFLNIVVLRTQPRAGLTFRKYLTQVKESVLGALGSSDVPFDRLLRELQPKRDLSCHPVFQVMFTIEPPPPAADPHWDLTQMDIFTGESKLDLYFEMDERPDGYIGRFFYSTDLFDAEAIRRMIGHWKTLLAGALANPGMELHQLPVLSPEETQLVSSAWNDTARDVPQAALHEMFEAQAARTPDAVAVESGGRVLTYRELNQEAKRLARRLQEEGAGPETLVALYAERSCQMVVAVLAILKSGAAYLPIDTGLPKERIEFIVQDSQASILLTERDLGGEAWQDSMRVVYCDERSDLIGDRGVRVHADNLAYVIYTSGSTGRPKGVEISHSAVVNFVESMRREPGFKASDTLLAVTTLSFDIAGLELFVPLTSGGRVVVATQREARDPQLLRELLRNVSPSVMQATPATWRSLLDAGWSGSSSLKILCGGEAMTRDLAQQLLPRCAELWNMYGPTETTIWSTVHKITACQGIVPIGRPIDNTQVYILDSRQNLVPAGVTGELYIGGAGVARGYLRRPELTEDRFPQVAAAEGARLYRTGDLARWRSDGTLECLGRADNQVKIRGFRVELEEIEAAMALHPGVREAAVKAWPDASGHLALVGYLVMNQETDLRNFLRNKLPEYMVPMRFVHLEELPLTPNGKVDRNRLPQPEANDLRAVYAAPASEIERRLVAIWENVLGQEGIGIRENFFELGGHSLLVAKLLGRIETAFGVRVTMSAIFEAPTIEQFAAILRDRRVIANLPRTVNIQRAGSRSPLLWIGGGPMFRRLSGHLGNDQPFVGVAVDGEESKSLPENFTMEEVAALLVRTIRAERPEGPYYLGGWCDAGIMAYEVACQLRRQGCEVELVVLLDAVNPTRYRATTAGEILASKTMFHLKRISRLRGKEILNYARERAAWMRALFQRHTPSYASSFAARLTNAALHYSPQPYAGRVVAIYPELLPSYRDPSAQWAELVTGDFQIHEVRGNHVTMLEERGAADIAKSIRACMTEAEQARKRRGKPAIARRAAAG